jgi:hypothetical protein
MPKQRLSLSWGPSFAELENGQDWARVYTAALPVPQLLRGNSSQGPFDARLSLSVLRRILDTRLGNSVAQIVTKGFEHWVLLRQEADPGRFDLAPSRREPLTNPENLFGLNERISSSGEVVKAIDLKDLEKISAELKKRGIERVCVNLLFTHRNPAHQNQTVQFLREKGFQVFSRKRGPDSQDELSSWRRNLLDASLSSFFEKLRAEIEEALPGSDLHFLDTERGFAPLNELSTSGLLFGREKSLQRKKPLLYFGPEEWAWIMPENRAVWKSPWGSLELNHPRCGFFSMQPGRELQLTTQGSIRWGADVGLDPGPMLWGRSSRLTLLDLMNWHWETTPPLRRNEKTEAKVHEQIEALKKNSRDWSKLGVPQIQKEIAEQLSESLLSDLAFAADSDEFDVGGVLAPALFPSLKSLRPQWRWNLIGEGMRETGCFWESSC